MLCVKDPSGGALLISQSVSQRRLFFPTIFTCELADF